jgi:hypothetical protein
MTIANATSATGKVLALSESIAAGIAAGAFGTPTVIERQELRYKNSLLVPNWRHGAPAVVFYDAGRVYRLCHVFDEAGGVTSQTVSQGFDYLILYARNGVVCGEFPVQGIVVSAEKFSDDPFVNDATRTLKAHNWVREFLAGSSGAIPQEVVPRHMYGAIRGVMFGVENLRHQAKLPELWLDSEEYMFVSDYSAINSHPTRMPAGWQPGDGLPFSAPFEVIDYVVYASFGWKRVGVTRSGKPAYEASASSIVCDATHPQPPSRMWERSGRLTVVARGALRGQIALATYFTK